MSTTTTTTTVTISNDYSALGDAATREDLERYTENLQAHLAERFEREVIVVTDCVLSARADDADVQEYVRELHAGDGWLELL